MTSYWLLNIVVFTLFTGLYFIFRPKLTLEKHLQQEQEQVSQNTYSIFFTPLYLILYFYVFVTFFFQYIINAWSINLKCGGGGYITSFNLTFFPWLMIFGILTLFISYFTGIKDSLSNIFAPLIINKNMKTLFKELFQSNNNSNKYSDDIKEIVENPSLLLNKITIKNFSDTWKNLGTYMTTGNTDKYKSLLFDMVIQKNNIGEFFWYYYTGIFVICITEYYIYSKKCYAQSINPQEILLNSDTSIYDTVITTVPPRPKPDSQVEQTEPEPTNWNIIRK